MTHRNAPLTVEGRRRAVEEVVHRGRRIAHVAAEFHIARSTLSKWTSRYRDQGAEGLEDRSSAPARRPSRLPDWALELIEQWRRKNKWSARRITRELADRYELRCCVRTITRWLDRLGLNRIGNITPDGQDLRRPGTITARYPGHMIHTGHQEDREDPRRRRLRIHGRDSDQAKTANRAKKGQKVGYTYLHSAIDGFSRLAYTEAHDDETAATATGFWARARTWFAAHGIDQITRLITDNGPCYKAHAFNRSIRTHTSTHQYIRPYTPRHNGKIERYNRILTEELLYARPFTTETQRRDAISTWTHHYNYHRPHTACGDQAPATRLHTHVDNIMTNYT